MKKTVRGSEEKSPKTPSHVELHEDIWLAARMGAGQKMKGETKPEATTTAAATYGSANRHHSVHEDTYLAARLRVEVNTPTKESDNLRQYGFTEGQGEARHAFEERSTKQYGFEEHGGSGNNELF